MNANELANKLEMGCYDWANDAATMLRKQAEEIEYWKSAFERAMAINEQVKYLESKVYGGSTK